MRNCLHKAANNPRSLIEVSNPNLSSFRRELIIYDDSIRVVSIKRDNSLSRYYQICMGYSSIKLPDFRSIEWLRLMKEDGYDGIDINENEGKYSVWRYE